MSGRNSNPISDFRNIKALDILDVDIIEILCELNSSTCKTLALKLLGDKGIIVERVMEICVDDMLDFASRNINHALKHKIPFTTVIITTKTTDITSFEDSSVTFKPAIICLEERDADSVFTIIKQKGGVRT